MFYYHYQTDVASLGRYITAHGMSMAGLLNVAQRLFQCLFYVVKYDSRCWCFTSTH